MIPTDPTLVRAAPGRFSIFVDCNFSYMDESKRYLLGEFGAYDEAVVVCRKIVDDFLQENHKAAITANELYSSYIAFGENPFISPDHGSERFSAWDYARLRCDQMCAA